MLACPVCGSLLESDGKNWVCQGLAVPQFKPHTTQIPDKRIGINEANNQASNRG